MAQAGKDPEPYLHWLLPSSSLCVGCWYNSSRRILKPLCLTDSSILKCRVEKLLLEHMMKDSSGQISLLVGERKKYCSCSHCQVVWGIALILTTRYRHFYPSHLILKDISGFLWGFSRSTSLVACAVSFPTQDEERKPSAVAKLFSCSTWVPLMRLLQWDYFNNQFSCRHTWDKAGGRQ